MWSRFISRTNAAALTALALISLAAVPGMAQTTKATANSAIRRMPHGHPDLQGTYDLATMTPMERFPGDPPVLTKEQAETLQNAAGARWSVNGTLLDPNPRSPPGARGRSSGQP